MTLDDLHKTIQSNWLLKQQARLTELMKKENVSRTDFSEGQLYMLDCFMLYARLMETCTQIENIPVYCRRFDRKYYHSNRIGQADFIQYHIEVYINKLFTISEIILSLTNEVYKLNLKPKQCNLLNIKKKLGPINPTTVVLEKLFKNLQNYRQIRNDSVHRNRFSKEDRYDRLSHEENLWMYSKEFGYELKVDWKFIRPPHFIDYFLKKERRDKIKFILDNNQGLFDYIDLYLKSIFGELKRNNWA